jgi:hypothetical protein
VNCRLTEPDCTRLASHTAVADIDVVITGSQVDSCASTQRDIAAAGRIRKESERSVGRVEAASGVA